MTGGWGIPFLKLGKHMALLDICLPGISNGGHYLYAAVDSSMTDSNHYRASLWTVQWLTQIITPASLWAAQSLTQIIILTPLWTAQ